MFFFSHLFNWRWRVRRQSIEVIAINTSFGFFFHGATAPSGPGPPQHRGFTITLRHTTLSKTPSGLVISLTQRIYLTTHNKYKRQTSMFPAGFELQIPICERLHTQDRVATGSGTSFSVLLLIEESRCVEGGRCSSGNLDISTQIASDADEGGIWISLYSVFLIPLSWLPQLSQGVPVIAGLLSDKFAVLGAVVWEQVGIRRDTARDNE